MLLAALEKEELELWRAQVASVITEPRASRNQFASLLALSGVATLDSNSRLCAALNESERRLQSRLSKVAFTVRVSCTTRAETRVDRSTASSWSDFHNWCRTHGRARICAALLQTSRSSSIPRTPGPPLHDRYVDRVGQALRDVGSVVVQKFVEARTLPLMDDNAKAA